MAGRRHAGCRASARSGSRCCSAALAVDWFYSPGIKPALPSSQRQPPRGKPTLPRPLRLPSAGPAPAPRRGTQGTAAFLARRALWKGRYLGRGV